ncbi:Zinc finger, C2H2-type/integrase, DNA-binding protein [Metarhizium guizhouense ARSEF 977]|uniref:Zinc finger, C2H2-type/integrase, DNA-binding protein n=1 Tax=Metarhizium guizhouense (strain ARSEF 977) TaxID=1276136 RepID=A0A0B4HUC5_METGA|nr:Zinc finger, C2H2-type/integrase, DNA-binding protein [Metarhizium guizhouense ARSEF 977]
MNRYLEHPSFSIDNVTIPAGSLDPQQPMWPDDGQSNDSGWEYPFVCMPQLTCHTLLGQHGHGSVPFDTVGVRVDHAVIEANEAPAIQEAHGRVEHLGPFVCVKCYMAFRNNTELWRHGKNAGHHPYACHCNKSFTRLDALKRHLNSRAAGRETSKAKARHSCLFCGKYAGEKGFDRRDHLLQHLRVRHRFEESAIAFMRVRAGAPAPSQL